MAKKLIQRVMQRLNMIPDKENIAQNKSLKFLGDKLHQPHLWHINRHSVARAFAVGGFAMYTPPLPWQMVIAAVLAVYFEANLPISVALVWITNPLTWIPLYYIAYSVGAFLLGGESYSFSDFQSVFSSLGAAWEKLGAPFLVGCFTMMILCAIAGYFGIQTFWRHQVLKAWEKRKLRRREGIRQVFEAMPGEPAVGEPIQSNAMLLVLITTWENYLQPFVLNLADMARIGWNAAGVGVQTFWHDAVTAWKQYQLERQETQQQAAEVTPAEPEPAPEQQTPPAFATLKVAWNNVGKPLALDGLKLAQIGASAAQVGARTFWNHAVTAWNQHQTEPQTAEAAPAEQDPS